MNPPIDQNALHVLAEISQDMFCTANHEGHLTWLSPRWSQILGWSEEELMAQPFLSFVHPADVERTITEAARLQEEGYQTVQFENRYRHKDGGWVWLEWNGTPGPDGQIYCTVRDVSRRHNEHRVQEERTRLLEAVERMAKIGHWRVNLKTLESRWSPEVYLMHGRDPETFQPNLTNAIEAYHPEDREMVQAHIERAVALKGGFHFEHRIIRPDGEVRYVSARGLSEVDDDGEVVAIFGVVQDITEARRLQSHLIQTERLASLGTMAAGIAHEINNPMTYVMANLDFIRHALESSPRAVPAALRPALMEALDEAWEGSQRISRIVRGLSDFSRTSKEHFRRISIQDVLESALRITSNELRHRARLVRTSCSVPMIDGDERELLQVFVNLLINATQALPEGNASQNTVELRIFTDDHGYATVEIQDSGQGIPAEALPRVFEPFFTTKAVGVGTGLGLSICHGIIKAHGGTLTLDSVQGEWTCARVSLPPCQLRESHPSNSAIRATAAQTRHVLIIDDEPMLGRLLGRILEQEHHTPIFAQNLKEATRLLDEERFDWIFCDLHLPGGTGPDIDEVLKAHAPTMADRIIFMVSASADDPEMHAFLNQRALPCLQKPFTRQHIRTLFEALDQRG